MKIKTQFILTMTLFGIMLTTISVSIILTSQEVGRLDEQAEIAHSIERGASDLGYLSDDYLLYREAQQRTRWESKFASFSSDLSRLKPAGPEQQALVDHIRENQKRWHSVFMEVAANLSGVSRLEEVFAPQTAMQVAWSRMAVQNQGIVYNAMRLSELLRRQQDRLRQQNVLLIVVLLVMFGAYFLANYILIYRRTLKSISDLQGGTQIIGSGDLDFVIPVNRNDEIGELSGAFNRMTSNLKQVTATKAELEREIAQRREMEEALRVQREWLQVTLRSIGDAVIATDTQGLVTFINPVAVALTGWEDSEALGRPIQTVIRTINEMTDEPAEDIVTRVLTEERIIHMSNHTALVTRSRDIIPIEDSAAPINDTNGHLIGVVLVFHDVTEKRRAQASLREAADRLRIVADFTYDWEYWRSEDNRFLYVSPSCERITGYTHEEFIQDPDLLRRIIHPDDRGRIWAHMGEDSAGEACELEFRILHRDGRERWVSHVCLPVVNALGRPKGRRASNRDITDRKQAEYALRDSQARFRILSETAGRLLTTDDPQGIVEDICSEVMAHLDCQSFFNFLADKEAGRLHLNASAGIPEAEAEKIRWLDYGAAVCGCVARDGSRIVANNIGATRDPRTELVESYGIRAYACHPLIVQGRVIGTLSFGTRTRSVFSPEDLDVMKTVADQVAAAMDRIQLIQQLRASRDELEIRVHERTAELEQRAGQLSRLASELTVAEERERRQLAGILHDNFQQLLVAAKMRLELLSQHIDTGQRDTAGSILDLILQLIKLSRELTEELSPPLLQNGLSASLKWLGRRMQEMHGLEVDLSVDPTLDPEREDYSVLLFQSVRELLFNVVKHAGVTSARIHMRKDEDGCHRIVVSDRGAGFDCEAIRTHTRTGSGFGLFTIQERMMLMGGRLEVESSPEAGSSFSLVLPSEHTEPNQERSHERDADATKTFAGLPSDPHAGDRIRVMLVDDHEVMRNGLATLLGNYGDIDIVGQASDGEEAVRSVGEVLPDVILMDINMPGMNGLEATRRIHSEFPHIRIIVLSMHEGHDISETALNAGASSFHTKSGSTDRLLAAIRGKTG